MRETAALKEIFAHVQALQSICKNSETLGTENTLKKLQYELHQAISVILRLESADPAPPPNKEEGPTTSVWDNIDKKVLSPEKSPSPKSDESPKKGHACVFTRKKKTGGSLFLNALPAQSAIWKEIRLCGDIHLDAQLVPHHLTNPAHILASITNHHLHFIPQWGHFAMKVGSTVLHGNVGEVLDAQKDRLVRHKECKRKDRCQKPGCRYFHDPATCPGSTDVRNFTALAWVYAPPFSKIRQCNTVRAFGNLASMEFDLMQITRKEARLFTAQVFHDLLCALVLAKYEKLG